MATTMPGEPTRREGSPWTGLRAVISKEMADHLTSTRMRIFEMLILITAVGTVYMTIQNLTTGASGDPFLYLRLFTTREDPIPAFVGLMGFFIPLGAIAIGFDAVNGEFNRRTLSRVLAQPIYRDALLFGKFLAGLFTLALVLASIWLIIMGLGIWRLGVPPSGEEFARAVLFLLAAIVYGGVWLALAMTFSTVFRQPATAALAAIAVWLLFTFFWGMISGLLAQGIYPAGGAAGARLELALARLSPNTLYSETVLALLRPTIESTLALMGVISPIQLVQLQWAVGTPLPLSQSLMLIWPHLTGLVAAMILLFALGYVLFQRQEIRA